MLTARRVLLYQVPFWMKATPIFIIISLTAVGYLNAAEPRPLPAYLPAAPSKDKSIADYTPAEVMGCISTGHLPPGHKFYEGKLYAAGLKAKWPGAKDATKIDPMIQFALDAPVNTDEGELQTVFDNLRYTIRKVMDVSETAKADALVRVVAAQTDALKLARAKSFAAGMFEELLDPRLLEFEREGLDDATVVGDMVREGVSGILHHIVTARAVSRNNILLHLERTLGMTIDESPFRIEDEAAGCAALKTWLTANWAQITAKCAEKLADPNRKLKNLTKSTWDARP